MCILNEISAWRRARMIAREARIKGPGRQQTFVWSLLGDADDVGVIEKLENGRFIKFNVVRGKPFGRVVGGVKRRYTLQSREAAGGH